jgi:threonine dehydrogenase-like Zn-dependent dehydrogenase
MKALYFDKKVLLREMPQPQPKSDEALINLKAVGICNTDLEIIKGYMGFKGILGHEFAGIVKECKDKHLLNKKVTGEINLGCGTCSFCLAGMKRHCPNRTVLGISGKDGAMAEYLTLPINNLHVLPDTIDFTTAIFVEPLAAACEILEQIHIKPGQRVLVIGDGKLAALVAQVIAMVNSHVTVVGISEKKVQLLKKIGINAQVNAIEQKDWDIIVECTGNSEGIQCALGYIKPRGTIILKSTYNENASINQNLIVVNEITLIGSRCGNFDLAIEFLRKGYVKTKQLVTKVLPLAQYQEAFAYAQNPDSFKIILEI